MGGTLWKYLAAFLEQPSRFQLDHWDYAGVYDSCHLASAKEKKAKSYGVTLLSGNCSLPDVSEIVRRSEAVGNHY